jgi:hypothetical protein
MLDHTINAGTTKCLVVLAMAMEDYRRLSGPLTRRDVNVIGLIPVETSNGEVVCGQLEQLATQYGEPLATVNDQGSDLKKGVALFQQKHPNVGSYNDIVHLVSRTIESIFESNSHWESYRKACCNCANFVRQSSLAHLKPPRPKTKARYMNFDREVRWAARAISILDRVREDRLTARQRTRLPRELVEQRLGWLDEYRGHVSMWLEVIGVGQAINRLVRRTGYRSTTAAEVRCLSTPLVHGPSQFLVTKVADDIHSMCHRLPPGEAVPGSTEVLESIIGKGKQLLYHPQNSLTRQILALAATTADLTTDLIQQALSTCRMKHLAAWVRDHLPCGVHVSRREDLGCSEEEQNLRKRLEAATPNF